MAGLFLWRVKMKNVENIDIFSIVTNMKKCTKCGEEKELGEYYKHKNSKGGLMSYCKKCAREKNKEYRSKPEVKERNKKRSKDYNNTPERKEYKKEWSKKYFQRPDVKERIKQHTQIPEVKAKIRKRQREWLNNKCKTDPFYKIKYSISRGLCKSLKFKGLSKNGRHWEDLVGYTKEEFKDYITPLFCKKIVGGKEIIMSWDNYGTEWQLDHIYPNAKCGDTEADVIYNYRLENLQPLWKEDNQEKRDRLDWTRDPNKYIKIA